MPRHEAGALLQRRAPGSLDALAAAKTGTFDNVDTALDDPCIIAFTSGTTGEPKGTMHFHRDVMAMCDCFPKSILRAQPDDIFCGTPPLAFTFGLGGMLCFPIRVGASTVLFERLTPETLLETMQRFRATIMFTAPTFYRQMAALAKRYDLSSLKKCVSAGEALPDATRQLWKNATGIEIIDGIGSTEMIHIFISHTPEARASRRDRPRHSRLPRDGARRRGAAVPAGGRRASSRSRDRPAAATSPTSARSTTCSGGWNLTGDAYKMDADGYFYYQARTDDMIISAGYNIAGPEVESALLAHEAVAECGVVGVPDEERGQIVKAFVVLKPGYTGNTVMVKTLQDYVKNAIAPYKYPRAIEFRELAAAHRNRQAAALQAARDRLTHARGARSRAPHQHAARRFREDAAACR